ncbi:hypothetical protein PTI98_000070 [Pleurotus ostreatus]|nr:hypothetical protein PTI98_000070 [Pleurotus ostreatus]
MLDPLVNAFAHLVGNYKFQTASYVLYIYDHLLTFSDEVDKIWHQPFTFASLLFYINRYITHCQFIIIQVEFYETEWPISVGLSLSHIQILLPLTLSIGVSVLVFVLFLPPHHSPRCDRYVKFAGAATMCLVTIAELVMILRMYGLYLGNRFILYFLLVVLCGQVVVMAYAISTGIRVPLPPGFSGCVLTGRNTWFAGLWAAPLVTDSCIFLLTLWRTIRFKKNNVQARLMSIFLRDGTLYFFIIFGMNLMNCLIYFLAVEDLKAMGASISQIMTAILIARLQLNLKRTGHAQSSRISASRISGNPFVQLSPAQAVHGGTDTRTDYASFFTIGNLAEDVNDSEFATLDNASFDGIKGIELGRP